MAGGRYGVIDLDPGGRQQQDGDAVEGPILTYRKAADGREKRWYVDVGWPQKVDIILDLHGLDEGSAALLHGIVSSLQPGVCLETGTHKGRSTHAIVSALSRARHGHLWTIDIENFDIKGGGRFSGEELNYVTFMVGRTPEMLDQIELPGPIEFAFLDAGHEKEELAGELKYVYANCAAGCVVAIDNTVDPTWPGVNEAVSDFVDFADVEHITIPTLTGMDILRVRDGEEKEEQSRDRDGHPEESLE